MVDKVQLPDLETVLMDINEVEEKLVKAKQKHDKMDAGLMSLKHDLELCKAEKKLMTKKKLFLQTKYEENIKQLHKISSEESKYDFNEQCFKNLQEKDKVNQMEEPISPEISSDDTLEKVLLEKRKSELKMEVENNNSVYKDILDKISKTDISKLN